MILILIQCNNKRGYLDVGTALYCHARECGMILESGSTITW